MAGSGRRGADERLIAELASGATVARAALVAGVSERTAYRRNADPDFLWRLRQARLDLVFRAIGKLADASADAVETLRSCLSSENESIRVRSATAILDQIGHLWATDAVEDRVVALEASVAKDLEWIDSRAASNGWKR